ncbi:hypothetical protein [Streptomyces sp. NPDC058701]|uniref:hypothetical protein n=1 Tax=Streptomyces sp. NPDC058701 TaxID=3346608 RepID=UPI00365B1139
MFKSRFFKAAALSALITVSAATQASAATVPSNTVTMDAHFTVVDDDGIWGPVKVATSDAHRQYYISSAVDPNSNYIKTPAISSPCAGNDTKGRLTLSYNHSIDGQAIIRAQVDFSESGCSGTTYPYSKVYTFTVPADSTKKFNADVSGTGYNRVGITLNVSNYAFF